MSDPILDAMFDGDNFDEEASARKAPDPEYGKGRWINAALREADAQAANDYGHSIMLKADLKGDEGMPFTWFVDAPVKPHENGDPDAYEKALKRYHVRLNQLKTLVHATGQWVEFNERGYVEKKRWPVSFDTFETDEAYEKLLSLFRQLTGRKIGLNVKFYKKANGKLAKDVWGLDPRQES